MKQITEKTLKHHGVDGQKWGVRRYQNPDGSYKPGAEGRYDPEYLKKGTKINTVYDPSRGDPKQKEALYTYRADDKWDNKVYKGPFSYFLRAGKGAAFVKEKQYEVTKDLKMPSSKERIDEFISLFEKENNLVMKDLKEVQDLMRKSGFNGPASKMNLDDNNRDDEYYKNAYKIFNHALENTAKYVSGGKYMKLMSQKYDAMIDDNNKDVYNMAHNPLIIFRANEVLKEIGKEKLISDDEIIKNTREVDKELRKYGKSVVL